MKKDKYSLDEMLERLEDDDDQSNNKKWNESIFDKFILLFPLIIFLITFLSINNDKSIIDLIAFIFFGGGLVLIGLLLNYMLSDK
tara:strand:+ start:214 stop:468 length:255 start_codon:yes stop_codon:yes gene_type:complete